MKLRNDIGSELESSGSCYSAPGACCGIRQEGGYKGISSSVMKTGIHAIKHGTSSRTASLLVRKPQGTHSCLLWGRRVRGARKQHGDLTAAAVQGTVGAVSLWLQGCPVGACRALSGPHFTLLAGQAPLPSPGDHLSAAERGKAGRRCSDPLPPAALARAGPPRGF